MLREILLPGGFRVACRGSKRSDQPLKNFATASVRVRTWSFS